MNKQCELGKFKLTNDIVRIIATSLGDVKLIVVEEFCCFGNEGSIIDGLAYAKVYDE